MNTLPYDRDQSLLGRMLPLQVLAQLLDGIGKDRFFQASPDRRVIHVPGEHQRFRSLFDRHAFQVAASNARQLHAIFPDAEGWLVDVAINKDQIPRMISAGVAVCAGSVRMRGGLDDFLQACRLATPDRAEFSCSAFLSPRGSSFGLHMDPKPTLILQVAGQRQWRFTPVPEEVPVEIGIALPPNADRVHLPWGVLHRPSAERMQTVTLNAGDALYLPAGCWHEGHSLQESFSLSLTTASLSPLAAFRKAIAEGVSGHPVCASPGECGCNASTGQGAPVHDAYQMVTPGLSLRDMRAAWDALADQKTQTVASCN